MMLNVDIGISGARLLALKLKSLSSSHSMSFKIAQSRAAYESGGRSNTSYATIPPKVICQKSYNK